MWLNKLIIRNKNTKEEIRVIDFNTKGVSLITDVSDTLNSNGNNVGKTTSLQIINICLGADINTLYEIEENKSQDTHYKTYLQNNIEFALDISMNNEVYKINIICSQIPTYIIRIKLLKILT